MLFRFSFPAPTLVPLPCGAGTPCDLEKAMYRGGGNVAPIKQGSGSWSLLNLDVNLLKMSNTCETLLLLPSSL